MDTPRPSPRTNWTRRVPHPAVRSVRLAALCARATGGLLAVPGAPPGGGGGRAFARRARRERARCPSAGGYGARSWKVSVVRVSNPRLGAISVVLWRASLSAGACRAAACRQQTTRRQWRTSRPGVPRSWGTELGDAGGLGRGQAPNAGYSRGHGRENSRGGRGGSGAGARWRNAFTSRLASAPCAPHHVEPEALQGP